MNYKKKLLVLIAISTFIKWLVAYTLELSNAESYYRVYAQKLQWNYFDHPPMVAWLIRLTITNLFFHNEIFVRFGAIIASAICTWLIFKIGSTIKDQLTGWLAARRFKSGYT